MGLMNFEFLCFQCCETSRNKLKESQPLGQPNLRQLNIRTSSRNYESSSWVLAKNLLLFYGQWHAEHGGA